MLAAFPKDGPRNPPLFCIGEISYANLILILRALG